MFSVLSTAFHRVSSLTSIVLVTMLYAYFIAAIMPAESANSQSYAGSWGSPDGHFYYTANELYDQIGVWSEEGRSSYIDFRLGLDIIWAVAYSMFLITITSCALRVGFEAGTPKQRLNLTALVPWLSDYTENGLGIYLVSQLPERFDGVATIAGLVTSLKWVSLGVAHVVMLWAIGAACIAAFRRTKFS